MIICTMPQCQTTAGCICGSYGATYAGGAFADPAPTLMPATKWPAPKFTYGQHVEIVPLDGIRARVIDLHLWPQIAMVEYDVRYFHDGKEHKIRVFEDELKAYQPQRSK